MLAALANEIIYLQGHPGISKEALTLQCIPAEYHNKPQKITPAVEEVSKERRDQYDTVLVGYGDCGAGGALDVFFNMMLNAFLAPIAMSFLRAMQNLQTLRIQKLAVFSDGVHGHSGARP